MEIWSQSKMALQETTYSLKKKLLEKIKKILNILRDLEMRFQLKKKLLDPNRRTRLKVLAKQFGVSEMQLHRIKTGENWGDLQV